MSRAAAGITLGCYVLALAALTLGASPQPALSWVTDALNHDLGLQELTRTDVERSANVLLFVPAGLLLCCLLPRTSRWLVWLLCVAVSVGVEAVQLILPGRDATPVDVVTNTTGAALGVLLHAVLPRRHKPGLPHRRP
ncbi:VanZ family protein [Blastococcus sp. SYSU D01042]